MIVIMSKPRNLTPQNLLHWLAFCQFINQFVKATLFSA
ncbi:hypothetical protein DOT_0148 [Desulfosporosinus sp. OT]|nr:hypothetical protein DOT_0148 [Desulfosporosinus sp. OT]